MMKRLLLILTTWLVSLSLLGNISAAEIDNGWSPQLIAWRTKLDANDPGMKGKWFGLVFDDSEWKTMRLPQHFEKGGLPDHDGTVWFRLSIDLPGAFVGNDLTLELGPIDDMDMTWFNGKQVGGIEQIGLWATPRKYKVPAKLVKAGSNVIVVRVLDHGWPGGFAGKAEQLKLSGKGHQPIPLAGDWRYRPGATLKSLGLGSLNNAATPAEVTPAAPLVPALVRPLAKPTSPVPPFAGGFDITEDQTIVILGGSNAAECQRYGWLETHLATAYPQHVLRARNMAWPADTVYRQQRPRNFFGTAKPSYGERDGRPRIAVDVAFLWFGQMESLEGESGLMGFTAAYTTVIDNMTEYTGRLVLVTPVPFEDPLELGVDVEQRNATLAKYAAVIQHIARSRNLPVVNLFSVLQGKNVTSDGQLLSAHGHQLAAQAFARQLGFSGVLPPHAEALRQVVVRKNELWHQYWLPSNWAFLYGNRQSQPSSRSHLDRSRRWFAEEVQGILPQLEQLDREIHNYARQR